jgi:uncharacterized membrane protein
MTEPADSMARLENMLGRLLTAGVIVSAIILAAGLVMYLARGENPTEDHVLVAGLVCLMATPLLRVVVSVVEYIRMRRWFFVVTTLVVLCELAVTVIYALRRV